MFSPGISDGAEKCNCLLSLTHTQQLTTVFHPKTFSVKIDCPEEALLSLPCIDKSVTTSHSKTHLGVSGASSFLHISLHVAALNGILVECLKDGMPQPD